MAIKRGSEGKVRLSKRCPRGESPLSPEKWRGGNPAPTDCVCVKSFTNATKVIWCLCALRQSRKKPTVLVAENTQKRESEAPAFLWSLLTMKPLQLLSQGRLCSPAHMCQAGTTTSAARRVMRHCCTAKSGKCTLHTGCKKLENSYVRNDSCCICGQLYGSYHWAFSRSESTFPPSHAGRMSLFLIN